MTLQTANTRCSCKRIELLAVFCLNIVLFASLQQEVNGKNAFMIDTFEDLRQTEFGPPVAFQGGSYVLTNAIAPFGTTNVLRIDYDVRHSEAWGGFLNVANFNQEPNQYLECKDATHLEFDYFNDVKQSMPERAHLRMMLLDGSSCDETANPACPLSDENYEKFYSFHFILDDDAGWKTASTALIGTDSAASPFWLTGWGGAQDNKVLDTDKIKGYVMEISIDGAGSVGDSSAGTIFIRNLRCAGQPFGASFALETNSWQQESFHLQDMNDTTIHRFPSGTPSMPGVPVMQVNYTVTKGASWGGYSALRHYPGSFKFYDLGTSTHLEMHYRNLQVQTVVGRAELRVLLYDGVGCHKWLHPCNQSDVEVFYSFHAGTLDQAGGWHKLLIPLQGTADWGSPFVRTGWAGSQDNDVLDLARIVGIQLEFSHLGGGDALDQSSGVVQFAKFNAIDVLNTTGMAVEGLQVCNPEEEISINPSTAYKKIEFQHSNCCERCESDLNCTFFQTNQRDCFLFGALDAAAVGLRSNIDKRYENFWVGDENRTGYLCEGAIPKCDCSGEVADCSNRGLQHLPLYQNTSVLSFTSLDLSGNTELVTLFAGSLVALQQLTSIDLRGTGVVYLPLSALPQSIRTVHVEMRNIKNLATTREGENYFSDVCCERLQSTLKTAAGDTIYYCNKVQDWEPCVDCELEPSWDYHDESNSLDVVKQDNVFGDAALSPEVCGELCRRTNQCTHFTWDGRSGIAEPVCYLKTSNYGRVLTTNPGYISGFTARARHDLHGAHVLFHNTSGHALPRMSAHTDYTVTYAVTLGERPKRGAVWISAAVNVLDTDRELSFSVLPAKLVIYPEQWDQLHYFTITVDPGSEVGSARTEVLHSVESCDEAFTFSEEAYLTRGLEVLFPRPYEDKRQSEGVKAFCRSLCAFNVSVAGLFLLWTIKNRKHPVVKASQSVFLMMVAIGAIVSSCTIIPLTMDDVHDELGLARTGQFVAGNNACVASVWLYSMGFVTTFAPLFAKTWRLVKLTTSKKMKRITISNTQVLSMIAGLILIDAIIIGVWTAQAPLDYYRVVSATDADGNPTLSNGLCRSTNDSTPYIAAMFLFHFGLLLYGNYVCYQVKNLQNTVLSEGKYVSLGMFSNLQVIALAAPLMVIVADDAISNMFVRCGVIFLNDLTVQILIFMPKIRAVHSGVGVKAAIMGSSGGASSGSTKIHSSTTSNTSLETVEVTKKYNVN